MAQQYNINVRNVYTTGSGLSAFTQEGLSSTIDKVTVDMPYAEELITALEDVLKHGPGLEIKEYFRKKDMVLLGATSIQHSGRPEALALIEGEELDDENVFKKVRLGRWALLSGTKITEDITMDDERSKALQDKLFEGVMYDVWNPVRPPIQRGIPIKKSTLVAPQFDQSDNDHIYDSLNYFEPKKFGEIIDLEQVSKLAIDDELRESLGKEVISYYLN